MMPQQLLQAKPSSVLDNFYFCSRLILINSLILDPRSSLCLLLTLMPSERGGGGGVNISQIGKMPEESDGRDISLHSPLL